MRLVIRYFFKTLRLIIGPIMLFLDFVTTPRGIVRSEDVQKEIDEKTKSLTLYEFKTCPFCMKVRRANKRLSLNIETKDAQHNEVYRQELLNGGGEIKVPCLRMVDDRGVETWMYESSGIIDLLQSRFAEPVPN